MTFLVHSTKTSRLDTAALTCTEDRALQGAQFDLQALKSLALLHSRARQLLPQLLPQLPQHLLRLQGGCLLVCHDLRPKQPRVAHNLSPGHIENGNSAVISSAEVQHLDTYASAALCPPKHKKCIVRPRIYLLVIGSD